MGIRQLTGLLAALLSAFASSAQEDPVCDDADHCVWIMENHGPHEFDYDLLTSELVGFGAEGKKFLIMLVGDKDSVIAGRATHILTDGFFRFTPEETQELVKAWPNTNVAQMADLMVKVGTPEIQGRMIESLLHKDKLVREQARYVLSRMRQVKKIYKLRPFEYSPIAKAVVEEPTRELVQMLAAFPKAQTIPLLQKVLNTNDGPSVIAAYQALYETDKEMAFATLLKTLRNLGDDQYDTAQALASLLQRRHQSRPDGFYMQFAKELAEDSKMTLMGRVVGLEAIANSPFPKGKSPIKLTTNDSVLSALDHVMKMNPDIYFYAENFSQVAEDKPELWAAIIARKVNARSLPFNPQFFKGLRGVAPVHSLPYVRKALGENGNAHQVEGAIRLSVQQNHKSELPAIVSKRAHWSDRIAALALTAEKAMTSRSFDMPKFESIARDSVKKRNCNVKAVKSDNYVRQLPYFDMQESVARSVIKRRFIRAAYPTQNGWFVGFDAGKVGGDLRYYDNESGRSQSILSSLYGFSDDVPIRWGVSSIQPVQKPKLGQYASQFWIVVETYAPFKTSMLYRLSEREIGWEGDHIATFQRSGFNLNPLTKNDYVLTHKHHSPIILKPNGQLRPACK